MFSKLFDMYIYVVKEKDDWTLWASAVSIFLWVAYFVMAIIFSASIYFGLMENSDDIYEFIPFLFFIIVLTWYWIYMVKARLKLKKTKNLKYNWTWIIKKLKVSEICKAKVSNNRWWSFNVICVKVKDWATSYYSFAYLKWKILWTSKSDLKKIYSEHWFVYDENESQKKELLNWLEWEISKMDYDIINSWIIKWLKLNKDMDKLINEKWIVESWSVPQYWKVNYNKISVGDIVDVYIDSNNPEIYWVDIDFLFDN